jgi:putative spermidine/putrescine transport system permease protein
VVKPVSVPARDGLWSRLGGADRYPLGWRFMDLINRAIDQIQSPRLTALVPFLLLLPALLLIAILLVGIVVVTDQSFHVLDRATFLLAKAYSLQNYAVLLSRSHYRELFQRTAGAAFLIAAICLVLGFFYAYFMVRVHSPLAKKLLLCCVFLPFLLGGVVRGYAWLVVLGREGLINDVLGWFGIAPVPLIYNMTGVLIGLAQVYLPIAVMMIAPAITAINEEIDEAAESLGAHWVRTLWTVILPMAMPGLLAAFVVVLTVTFSDMAIPTILGAGRADFITNAIFTSYMETGDRGIGAALCVATTFAATGTIALLFLLRTLVTRRTRSAG